MSANIKTTQNQKERRTGRGWTACLFAALGVILDQWTKHLTVIHLKDQPPVILIDGVFQLRYLENRGAAFGIMQNRQWFFLLAGVLILAAVLYLYRKLPTGRRYLPLRICAVLISAGAVGNMIDRIRLGYVIDFFYFNLIDFPIFNVADVYVTCATAVLVVLILFYYREEDLESLFYRRGRK